MADQAAKQALSLPAINYVTIAKLAHLFFILALHKEGAFDSPRHSHQFRGKITMGPPKNIGKAHGLYFLPPAHAKDPTPP